MATRPEIFNFTNFTKCLPHKGAPGLVIKVLKTTRTSNDVIIDRSSSGYNAIQQGTNSMKFHIIHLFIATPCKVCYSIPVKPFIKPNS